MQTKNFVLLLIGVLVLGGGFGGSFAGGVALGKNQQEAPVAADVQPPTSAAVLQGSSGQSELPDLNQLREQMQSGEIDEETLNQLREQFQSRFSQGEGGLGFASGRLSGTIEAIDGNAITVNTAQGSLKATVVRDTTIQVFSEGDLTDIETDLQVMVMGQRDEDGTVVASSILIAPDGIGSLFSLFGGGRTPGGR